MKRNTTARPTTTDTGPALPGPGQPTATDTGSHWIPPADPDPWDLDSSLPDSESAPTPMPEPQPESQQVQAWAQPRRRTRPGQFDIEGLQADFPRAQDLERFVFDETGHSLNLRGRSQAVKYSVALAVLEGQEPDPQYVTVTNPWVDPTDLVPVAELRELPTRDPHLPDPSQLQNEFFTRAIPHPDPDYRAAGRHCDTVFRKYRDGVITYQVIGPIDQRARGERIDKFGRTRPEILDWVDPRTPETMIQDRQGVVTPRGRRLRAIMQTQRVNDSNFWDVWIDRSEITVDTGTIDDPWS